MKTKYYAAINDNGTAMGIGRSETFARQNAADFLDEPEKAGELKIVEITRQSWVSISSGNPDAVERVSDEVGV